jgi:RNA polymerase sigma factor (sigma-70 family)
MSLSDDLLPRVAAGEAAAVEECVDRYGGLVWVIALRLSPTKADAEDAVREVFAELWGSAERFDRNRTSETTFVAMIARRCLIDRRFESERSQNPLEPKREGPGSRDHGPMESVSDVRVAARVIQELPEERRWVLSLAIYEGMSHERISSETGIALATVKSHVKRGLLLVRERLESVRKTKDKRTSP